MHATQLENARFAERNTVKETCAILKLSRSALHKRIKAGLIAITKDGARTFISGAEIARYLAACEASTLSAAMKPGAV